MKNHMNENHQSAVGSKTSADEEIKWVFSRKSNLWVPKHKKRTGFEGKTIWDWTQLLIIPLVLAIGGFLFTAYQHNADQQRTLDQQQAAILQTYIDNIQDLLLNHDLQGLGVKLQSDSVRHEDVVELARARTLTALRGLDSERKGILVKFIYEAGLIGFDDNKANTHDAVIYLDDSDLRTADLSGASLSGANLNSVHLNGADLSGAYLFDAHLNGADLSGANLIRADLNYASLSNAYLTGAVLTGVQLTNAYLFGAYLRSDDLSGAYLTVADFSSADLSGADLRSTYLSGANLSGANLSGAHNLTQQQLDQVYSCKDATLPPGLICHQNH
jgi:uncharacterized protein YjbI with pentapeptide repeats